MQRRESLGSPWRCPRRRGGGETAVAEGQLVPPEKSARYQIRPQIARQNLADSEQAGSSDAIRRTLVRFHACASVPSPAPPLPPTPLRSLHHTTPLATARGLPTSPSPAPFYHPRAHRWPECATSCRLPTCSVFCSSCAGVRQAPSVICCIAFSQACETPSFSVTEATYTCC